jgi:hypothetical protein
MTNDINFVASLAFDLHVKGHIKTAKFLMLFSTMSLADVAGFISLFLVGTIAGDIEDMEEATHVSASVDVMTAKAEGVI